MSQAATPTIHKLSVVEAEGAQVPFAATAVESGDPVQHWAPLWRNEAGELFNGVWHCTPGVFNGDHCNETLCLSEGRVTVTPTDGEPVELRAGDMAFLPAGTRARWEVHETLHAAVQCHDIGGAILRGE